MRLLLAVIVMLTTTSTQGAPRPDERRPNSSQPVADERAAILGQFRTLTDRGNQLLASQAELQAKLRGATNSKQSMDELRQFNSSLTEWQHEYSKLQMRLGQLIAQEQAQRSEAELNTPKAQAKCELQRKVDKSFKPWAEILDKSQPQKPKKSDLQRDLEKLQATQSTNCKESRPSK